MLRNFVAGNQHHAPATKQLQESTSSTVDKVFAEREAETAYFLRKRRDLTCINSSFTSNSSIRLPIWHRRRRRRMGRAPASVVLSASNKQQLSKRRSLHSRRQLVGWATFVFCLTAIGMLSRIQTMSREIEINLSSNTATSRTSDVQNHHSRLRQKKICFLQSVFGEPSLPSLDRPYNVSLLRKENPLYEFYYFTNMPQLETPGWTKILMDDREFLGKNIQRHITMSRQPKFLGWKIHDPIREKCRLVIYMDGHFHPRSGKGNKFDRIAQSVERSQFGLIHTTHPKGGTLTREFERIVSGTKDTQEHVDASLKWLQAQPDWNNNATLYWNAVFGMYKYHSS